MSEELLKDKIAGWIGQAPKVVKKKVAAAAEIIPPPSVQQERSEINYSWIVKPPKALNQVNPYSLSSQLLPDANQNGTKAKPTLQNFKVLFSHMGAVIRYNVIAKKQEIFLPGVEASPDNYDRVVLAHLMDACARVGLSDQKLESFLTVLADENQFNPVESYILSTPWDGCSRLVDLYATVNVAPEFETLKCTFIRKWLIMAVAAAVRPEGIAAPGMLVFQGDQYIGKTKWLLSLVPQELGLALEGLELDTGKADSIRLAISHWLVELGELDGTLNRSEQAALKAFLTRQSDTLRAPYARAANQYARRTVFFGSVNRAEFLSDRTGNRRFWTIAVKSLNFQHNINMQQVWAEVLSLYRGGEQWWPDQAEMGKMNESNERFLEIDPLEQKLVATFDWSVHGVDLTATEILESLGFDQPTKAQTNAVAACVRKLNRGLSPGTKSHVGGRKLWVGRRRTGK